VPVVMVKNSAAHSNAVSFPPIASGYFGYVDYSQFYVGGLRLQVVVFCNV
jgi:hypothetical protein